MNDKLTLWRAAAESRPAHNRLWPLYGAGFENLGLNGRTIERELPRPGPGELLVRHDACGLCFSDIKIIAQGEKHPRIFRDMKKEPVVLGHEVCITVVEAGENLRAQYRPGDRFIIQADIFVNGVGYAYGYMLQGALSLYALIDQRILNGDQGNYLLPVRAETGYAESALAEPWACVVAAYTLRYRTALKAGGTAWFLGAPGGAGGRDDCQLTTGFDAQSHPARVWLSKVPPKFAAQLRKRAAALGVEVREVPAPAAPPLEPPAAADKVDDIVLLGADPGLFEAVAPYLAPHGVLALLSARPLSRPVMVDVGRVHYDRWVYVGGTGPDIARAYADVPVRSTLKPGGKALFVGAGGPIGRMHVQRAIQLSKGPRTIVCTDASDLRLNDLRECFAEEARAKGLEFLCLNPMQKESYAAGLAPFRPPRGGFDDVLVLAPVAAAVSEAYTYLAERGVMNIFAGVARGTLAKLDVSHAASRQVRVIGHSASSIEDLREVLRLVESRELSTNRSVAAVGSLSAAKAGLQAVKDTVYPGKVVIFPHIREFPLTAVPDLKEKLPTVYAKLRNGREWTLAAEAEFLRLLLPDETRPDAAGAPAPGAGEVF